MADSKDIQRLMQAVADHTVSVNSILDQPRIDSRPGPSKEQLKTDLENDFLAPSTRFDSQWLNKLQERWDIATDHTDLFQLAPTQTRTIVRFTREGLNGEIKGYQEVTVPAGSATAKNSTSFLRKPAKQAEFVRGIAGSLPFTPGGLGGVEEIATAEEKALARDQEENLEKPGNLDRLISFGAEGALLEKAPGFDRGINISNPRAREEHVTTELVNILTEESEKSTFGNAAEHVLPGQFAVGEEAGVTEDHDEIDSLLPIEFPSLAPRGQLAVGSGRAAIREWAHMVDMNRGIPNFHDLVPDMAREWPFELDTFQKEAIYHLENGDSVFVAAHTSAGKTVIAEYAIALAAKHMTKTVYTSPIKALSNQKFRDFQAVFDDVGIITGDVQIRPEASCLIMTTEILRSMLYRGADIIRDIEFVVFDEVHYVNDLERGVVWEEVIIMLPEHVTLILLSATVPNTYEFATWVGRTKKKHIYVISTAKRPVPLEHYLWSKKSLHKIVDSEKRFSEKGWKDADDAFRGRESLKATAASTNTAASTAASNTNRGRGGQRGASSQRGRGQPSRSGRGNVARTGRGGGRTTAAQDRNLWVHLVQHLRKEELLPVCIFVFSKKRCEENADALSNLDYCTNTEKSAIHMVVEKSIARLRPEDRALPQIRRIRELLSRGIAVHHGGILPIIKEMVEILFAKSLVKVLFATETFAMGLNLPTRTVAFSGFRKHDGRSFRDLLPGEYTQMAGRAGRRGIDSVGTVIIVTPGAEEAPPASALRQMILGTPSKLRSQFRLTYNMILNLLRVEALKIEEMIKRSFSENATQALLPQHQKAVKLSEMDLSKIKRESCEYCDQDIGECHNACMRWRQLTNDLHLTALASPTGRRMFGRQRIVVFKRDGIRSLGVLAKERVNIGPSPSVSIIEIRTNQTRRPSDLLPFLPQFRPFFPQLTATKSSEPLRVKTIALSDIECLTSNVADILSILDNTEGKGKDSSTTSLTEANESEETLESISEMKNLDASWNSEAWAELNWARIKDLPLQEILLQRAREAEVATGRFCLRCPNFTEHFSMEHDEWLIKENITQLRRLMSDQNLQLLPDYEQRIGVLKDLGFIDENSRVELKGKVACEIHSTDELVLTELILENVLADYTPEEIAALLSAFVFQEKTDVEPTLTANLQKGKAKIIEISAKINSVQTMHQVILAADDSNDFISRPRFGMVEVVYEWARGMSFNRITDLTDIMEGTIVRVITRLDETCREVRSAARIIGDPTLFTKMQACQELIRRDLCSVASLYM